METLDHWEKAQTTAFRLGLDPGDLPFSQDDSANAILDFAEVPQP
jgi:hypothetical protein